MSNNQFVLESFNKSLYAYHSFKTQLPSLLAQLQTQNSKFNNSFLDHISKILSSKYSAPSQKFYALYSLLKCIEAKNETFIDDLAQKDELIAKILEISQTDMEQSETTFTRGTNYFSANPSRGQAKAGTNMVKLSIEIICYLGQTWGVQDRENPRSILALLMNSLKEKMSIPKTIWFINKDYIIPENRELYCWNFNRKSPEVTSQGPFFVLEDKKVEMTSKPQAQPEAQGKPSALDNAQIDKKKEAEVESKPKPEGNLSGEKEVQKQADIKEQRPSTESQDEEYWPKYSNVGSQDKKDVLKPSKIASEPAKAEEINSDRATVLSDFLKNQNKALEDVKDTENAKKSLNSSDNILSYAGISICTPRDELSQEDQHSKEQKENTSAKKGLFKTTDSRGLANKKVVWVFDDYSRLSAGEDEKLENILIERKGKKEVTFGPTQHQSQDVKEKRQSLLGRSHTFNVNTDINKSKDKENKDINTREKMNAGIERIRSTPTLKKISPIVNSKFVGPKHIEERLSPTFLNRSAKGKKTSKLEKELLEIENSIKKSMQRTPITPKISRPMTFTRAQSMRTGESIPEKDANGSEEREQEDFPDVNYLPLYTAKIRDTKLAVPREFGESTDTKRKLNFSNVKSEANNQYNTAKIGPVSNFDEKVSKWKSVAGEKMTPVNQGNIRQLNKDVPQPKKHFVKESKEVEPEYDSDKENIFKVKTPRTSSEKKNLKSMKPDLHDDKAQPKDKSANDKGVIRNLGRKLRNF